MTMNVKLILCLILVVFTVDSDKTGHQSFYWSEWKPGDEPVGSVVGGKNQYIGRAYTRQGILVASINFKKKMAVATHTRKNVYRQGVEILRAFTKDELYWEGVVVTNSTSSKRFKNAIRGGFHKNISSTLYIGRVKFKTYTKLGMVFAKKKPGLWICTKRNQYKRISKFQLLKYKTPESKDECDD